MQIEHKTEKGTLLFISRPNDADVNFLATVNGNNAIVFNYNEKRIRTYDIPGGNWQLIGLTSEVAEINAMNMLDYRSDNDEHQSPMFKNYVTGNYNLPPLLSFKSLMQHLGVEETSVVLFK